MLVFVRRARDAAGRDRAGLRGRWAAAFRLGALAHRQVVVVAARGEEAELVSLCLSLGTRRGQARLGIGCLGRGGPGGRWLCSFQPQRTSG